MLTYALLGFLTYQNASGYDLKQLMDVSTSNFWHAKQSQIYTTLKKMEKDELVLSHIEPQESRPNRRVYEITEAGRADLKNWTAQPITQIESRKEKLLLKLFFSAQLDPQRILTELRLQKNLHQTQLEKYQTITKDVIAQFSASLDMQEDAKLWEATRRFGELYAEMYVRWLDETIKSVEQGAGEQ
ncbi:MAG: PadR family transcriptional regulator [Anaerolineae bacterium]|jgi:PadR family transcriptional regulator AphA|nr:PadR family transcriptional regulator [Anaerolineae bacterium]MBT4310507.1 PadR family transcriptional regulator [Anaerolineae bacterium]MBT4457097.1 PadR family transcriptional regulator [Anaerolineae bacterium]MBT4842816.1 PadR family transcriptional regulator [Anaerolineae bacterium]MBT6062953.1 PadR family transcriptional regulator [Anaerolineae bacterium]